MTLTSPVCLFFLLLLTSIACISADDSQPRQVYNYGNNGQVIWMWNCDWEGNDIAQKPSTGEQCGGVCIANPQCNHFTYYNGVCYMKKAKLPTSLNRLTGAICGWVRSRAWSHVWPKVQAIINCVWYVACATVGYPKNADYIRHHKCRSAILVLELIWDFLWLSPINSPTINMWF